MSEAKVTPARSIPMAGEVSAGRGSDPPPPGRGRRSPGARVTSSDRLVGYSDQVASALLWSPSSSSTWPPAWWAGAMSKVTLPAVGVGRRNCGDVDRHTALRPGAADQAEDQGDDQGDDAEHERDREDQRDQAQ